MNVELSSTSFIALPEIYQKTTFFVIATCGSSLERLAPRVITYRAAVQETAVPMSHQDAGRDASLVSASLTVYARLKLREEVPSHLTLEVWASLLDLAAGLFVDERVLCRALTSMNQDFQLR